MTMNPSWKQLAEIPESLTRARVIRALGVEVPPEGRARSFQDGGVLVAVAPESGFYVAIDGAARWVDGGSAVIAELKASQRHWMPVGTPTGDALRAWLRSWGWVPKGAAAPAEAPPPMVI
jgi:hypothetical protein